MGSKGGPRAVQTPYSGTETSNQNQSTGFSSNASSTVPEWVRNAGQELFGRGTNFIDNWQLNPLIQQGADTASQIGAFGPRATNSSYDLYMQDRGGGYSEDALRQLLAFGDDIAPPGSGSANTPGIDRSSVRDVNWRDFTDFNIDEYMNPYTQNVIDASVSDVERNAEQQRLARASRAMKSGVFGGSASGVENALAGGEVAREIGSLTSRLRAAGFDAAANLIGRDQAGGFGAQQANQNADLGVAQTNADLAARSADRSAQVGAQNNQARLAALQSALSGGINLGGLDVARAGGLQNLGSTAQQLLASYGFGMQEAQNTPFDFITGLGGMLSGLPIDRQQSNSGSSTSTSSGTSTQSGTGAQVVNTPNEASANWGTALALIGAFF